MAELTEPLRLAEEAQKTLEQSRTSAAAWSDAQRAQLDRAVLDPLAADARRLTVALERAARDIEKARRMLVTRPR